jgi:hypothetical protein
MQFSFRVVSLLVGLILTGAIPNASAQVRLDVFVTPIPNAPFSGLVNVQRSVVQRDGSIANLKTIRGIGRDSKGRIYSEATMLLPIASTETPQVLSILIYDPETRISITLHTPTQRFSKGTVNRPPETTPPALLDASAAGNSLPQNQFTKREDLGTREIEGVPAHGVRQTQTIPAENGAGKEIVVTDELWYSEDLRINLVIKHNDPRTGSVTLTVTQIKRTEPDPVRFEIPEGYKPVGMER